MKIYEYDIGHMTKMAAMPIYGKKNLQKSLPEPVDRFQQYLVFSIRESPVHHSLFK